MLASPTEQPAPTLAFLQRAVSRLLEELLNRLRKHIVPDQDGQGLEKY
jgi:hypothetical protein